MSGCKKSVQIDNNKIGLSLTDSFNKVIVAVARNNFSISVPCRCDYLGVKEKILQCNIHEPHANTIYNIFLLTGSYFSFWKKEKELNARGRIRTAERTNRQGFLMPSC